MNDKDQVFAKFQQQLIEAMGLSLARPDLADLLADIYNDRAAANRVDATAMRPFTGEGGYQPLVEGTVTIVPYKGVVPDIGDVVMVNQGEQVGCIGAVIERTFSAMRTDRGHVVVNRIWPPGTWATQIRFECVDRLVRRIPEFATPAEADAWHTRTRDVEVGQDVRFTITGGWGEELTYTGRLAAILEWDVQFWWRHAPKARGKFEVLHMNGDDPMMTTCYALTRI